MKALRNFTLLAALALSGFACGPANVPAGFEFVDVTGTVTMADGKPLKSGTITFEPSEAGKGREDVAGIADGKFTTKMAAGTYKVAIDKKTDEGVGGRSLVPARFQKFETSTFTAVVKGGMAPLVYELK